MTPDHKLTEEEVSGGIKLGAMRYVLAVSVMLAAIAGMVIWNFFAG